MQRSCGSSTVNRAEKRAHVWTSLVVQRLRPPTPNAGAPGSIPGQGTRSHMLQLRPGTAKFYKHLNRFFLKAHMAGVKGVREREAYLLRGSRGIRQQQSLYWVSVHSQGT